jgi:nicotinamide-nucleotide amidase
MNAHERAAVLSAGDELTLGQALDTNSRWISDQLLSRGIITVEHITVPDDLAAIGQTLTRLMNAVPLVICTGGLGPTQDDLTRQALAEALAEPLLEDEQAVQQIEAFFAARGRPMPSINRIQALRPRSAGVLPNPLGTAPGLHARAGRCDIFCLPGPPREMQPMFATSVLPRLRLPSGRALATRTLHAQGLSESEIAMRLGELMGRAGRVLVGTTASGAIVSCRLRCQGSAEELAGREPQQLVDDAAAEVQRRLDPYIFAEGEQSLPAAVRELLIQRSHTLAVVESCTGGMLGSMLTEVPGSSAAFVGGWITYSNQSKQRDAGVPAAIFATGGPGAVSRQCAQAMALGGLQRASAHQCLAITGIAGPEGGTSDKPVGTVWIALASQGPQQPTVQARRFLFVPDRANIRDWACKTALGMLRLSLLGRADLPLLAEQP